MGQSLFAVSVIGLSLMVAPACVDNDQSIYIRQVMAPPTTRTGGVCSYQADPAQPALAEGTVDVLLRQNYEAFVLVGNQMTQRGDSLASRAEPNRAHIDGAIVRVTDPNGNEIGEFTSQATGFVDAANGNVSSFGLMSVNLIDAPTLAKIASGLAPLQSRLVLAQVKAFGETLGGDDLESGEFQFPITVCKGCLISFEGADDPASPGIDCNLAPTAGGAGGSGGTTNPPCSLGFDEKFSCTLCKDTVPECRTLSTQ